MKLLQSLAWYLPITTLVQGAATAKQSAVIKCLSKANVPQALPNSSVFSLEKTPWNPRVSVSPAVITLPTTVRHVQSAIKCASKIGIPVTAKSGGHSYTALGLGGEDGHLVIDLIYMNAVKLDNKTNVATIGPGARLGNIAIELFNQGGRAFSHGTCPGVGIGGHVLHGGYGYSSFTHGLALDALVEATVVLANGNVVSASATHNCDLFWALRGAGSSFGIVTNLKFNTFAAPSNNIVFNYTYFYGTPQQSAQALDVLQNFASVEQPAELNLRVLHYGPNALLAGVYYGTRAAFDAIMQPLLAKLGPGVGQVQTLGWLDTLHAYANGDLPQPLNYTERSAPFFAKSLMTPLLSQAALTAYTRYLFNESLATDRIAYTIIDLHGGAHSAISAVPPNATSYAHRSSILKFQFSDISQNGAPFPENGYSLLNNWVKGIMDAMPGARMGMYINYADDTLTEEEAHRLYWLDHYSRLVEIKRKFDPKGLITFPQAVGRL